MLTKDAFPVDDIRKEWAKTKAERQRLLKQYAKIKKSIEYRMQKGTLMEEELKKNSEKLNKMRGIMLADLINDN